MNELTVSMAWILASVVFGALAIMQGLKLPQTLADHIIGTYLSPILFIVATLCFSQGANETVAWWLFIIGIPLLFTLFFIYSALMIARTALELADTTQKIKEHKEKRFEETTGNIVMTFKK